MRAFLYSVLMTTAALFTSIVVEGTRQIGREELGPECAPRDVPAAQSCEDWGQVNRPCFRWPNTKACFEKFMELRDAPEKKGNGNGTGEEPSSPSPPGDVPQDGEPKTIDDCITHNLDLISNLNAMDRDMTMMLHKTVGDDEPESFCRSEEYWASFGYGGLTVALGEFGLVLIVVCFWKKESLKPLWSCLGGCFGGIAAGMTKPCRKSSA